MSSFKEPPSGRRVLPGGTESLLAAFASAEPPLATAQGSARGTQLDGQADFGDFARHRARDPRIGELNKFALNYASGRSWVGIHRRSDAAAAFALGEEMATALLEEQQESFAEPFEGFASTRFDGTRVTL